MTRGKGGGTALVLEGGGYRGAFTAGVLDVLMEHDITGFGSLWGTSAGALNGANFLSRQIGRSIRIMRLPRQESSGLRQRSRRRRPGITCG